MNYSFQYSDQSGQVSWHGVVFPEGHDFTGFLETDVADRLGDRAAETDFENHLRGLAITGFARENLEAVLSADIPEEREWAIGESIAEAFLGGKCNITWPWNMERDKRVTTAILPGADLVGFEDGEKGIRLALGEVKTSSQELCPPTVMSGRSGGMMHQIDNLANNLSVTCKLLKWLWPRCKNGEYEDSFNAAVCHFVENGNKGIALFGVLVRDTSPNEGDLSERARDFAEKLTVPTTCQLFAVYLPCAISELPARLGVSS